MATPGKSVLVAGHLCLDIIPSLDDLCGGLASIVSPGKLFTLPPAVIATGGAVPNTGCALHRLGVKTTLVGKIGDDALGVIVRNLLEKEHPTLAADLIIAPNDVTAHAITLSAAGTDRIFLCCPGANDNFTEDDLRDEILAGSDILHLGYPPLLKRMYEQQGLRLKNLFSRAKTFGMTVSLDMSKPDPDSEAGRIDWRNLLQHVLPYVDIFLPSLDEIAFMLNIETKDILDAALLDKISRELLSYGPSVVALKLSNHGLYLRTTADECKWNAMGRGIPVSYESWISRQLLTPCFSVDVRGTTGAGDCTIAGFLAAFVRDLPPESALPFAVGAGACCVEKHDALSGIVEWDRLEQRINAGWRKRKTEIRCENWLWNEELALWQGPADSRA